MIKGKEKINYVSNLLSVKERVIVFLQANPELRDNNLRLVANYWHYEILKKMKKEPKEMTAVEFFAIYASGKLTPADTITRASRSAQLDMPDLRGEKWEERQGLQSEVQSKINQPVKTKKGN